jgi:anti-anti-sigma regulatory factor
MVTLSNVEMRIAELETAERRAMRIAQINESLSLARTELDILGAVADLTREHGAIMPTLSFLLDNGKLSRIVAMQDPNGNAIPLETLPATEFETYQYPHMNLAMQNPDIPLMIGDIHTDERLTDAAREVMKSFAISSFVVMILRTGTGYQGVLSFAWIEPQNFNAEMMTILRSIQPTAAAILANYRLRLELENRIGERTQELIHAQAERETFQQQIIEGQRQALQELSTPIIPLLDGIIILPLIGSIDTARARDIMRSLLKGIADYRAKIVILDITGVPVVDSGVANHLNKTIQAARLKGTHTIITGVSDAVAETIVDLGIDWGGVETLRDLQSGLITALGRLGMTLRGTKLN